MAFRRGGGEGGPGVVEGALEMISSFALKSSLSFCCALDGMMPTRGDVCWRCLVM